MNHAWRRAVAPLVGLLAGGSFLYFAFRTISVETVAASLAGGHWFPAAPAILLGVAVFIGAKARRWRTLLGDPADLPTATLISPVAIGLLFNSLVPHSGELARAVTLQRSQGLAVSGVLMGIAVERLFDFLTVLVFGLVAGGYTEVPPGLVAPLRLLGVLSLGLGSAVLMALLMPGVLSRIVHRLTAWWPARPRHWLQHQVAHALAGLKPLRAAHRLPQAFGWSAVQWASVVWCIYFCAAVPGFTLSTAMSALVLIAIVVIFTLPNAPGYLGSTQVAFLAVLVPLGVGQEQALAASFVYTLLAVVPMMLAGAVALLLGGRRPTLRAAHGASPPNTRG